MTTTTMISGTTTITEQPIYGDYEIEIENIKNKLADKKDKLVAKFEPRILGARTRTLERNAKSKFAQQLSMVEREANRATRSLLEEFAARWHIHRISIDVAYITGLSIDDILSAPRRARIAQGRRVCIWLIRETTDSTYPILARLWKCNHTTLIHSYQQVQLDIDRRKGPLWELLCDVLKYASCPYEGLSLVRKRV